MKKRLLLIGIFLTSGLYSQKLTLNECIDKTLSNHPDIKSFILKVEQSKKSYTVASADYLPQVNLHAEYNPLQTYALPVNGSFHTIDEDSWSIGLNLKQKIWDFSKTSSKIKASKLDEDISKLLLEDSKALMVYKVKSLYGLMVVQKEAIEVRQKDLEAKKAYYEQSKALVKQGLKTDADASRFLSAVYIAKDKLASSKAAYEKAKTTLSLYIKQEIKDDIELEYSVIKKDYHFDTDIEEKILQNNYQLQMDTQNIDKNRLLHKSAKASHYGSVDAVASYNHLNTLNSYDSKLIGVTLNVPLYSGGRTTSQAEKAQIGLLLAKEKKDSKILALKDEINSLFIDIKRYKATIKAKQAQEKAAIETKNVLEARYKEGLTTYIEVLDAISLLLDARLGTLEAYYAKSIIINRIKYLKGEIS